MEKRGVLVVFAILIFIAEGYAIGRVGFEKKEFTAKFLSYGFEVSPSTHTIEELQQHQNENIYVSIFHFKMATNYEEIELTNRRTSQKQTLIIRKVASELIFEYDREAMILYSNPQTNEVHLIETLRSSEANRWMELLGSKNGTKGSMGSLSLAEIALPGTHDSGTFSLTLQSVQPPSSFIQIMDEVCAILNDHNVPINCSKADELAEVFSYPWSVTQKQNWKKQMEEGCRSFDYRAYQRGPNDWVIQHSLVGSNMTSPEQLSSAVVNFLDKYPGELIIIEYSVYGDGNETELVDMFLSALGKYAYHWVEGATLPGNPLIADMIATNQRAILVRENGGQQQPVSVGISNDYPDSCNNDFILQYDAAAIQNFANESPNAMRKIAWQATPGAVCIALGILGTLTRDHSLCVNSFGFDCSMNLMGYIDQLNSEFDITFVLEQYSQVKPISEASYFGNLWNFDHPSWEFIQYIPSLDIILLANQLMNNQ